MGGKGSLGKISRMKADHNQKLGIKKINFDSFTFCHCPKKLAEV
jgi:hypothetical protein